MRLLVRLAAPVSVQEFSRVMGKPPPPMQILTKASTFCGHTVQSLRARAKKRMARDTRSFKTKAIEAASLYRERQLQMQEKQREMLTRMQGPDWPKEDWPLTNSDAKHVGDAENIIHSGLDELSKRAGPGGVAQVHETGDENVLEIVIALGEMMSCYTKLIDRHAEKVKRSRKKAEKVERREEISSPNPSPTPRLGEFGLASLGTLGLSSPEGSSPPPTSDLGDLAWVGSSLGGLGLGGPGREPDLAWGGLSPPAPPKPQVDSRWTAAQPVYNDAEL